MKKKANIYDADDVERSKKAGINKHIAKPLTGESVIREIKSML